MSFFIRILFLITIYACCSTTAQGQKIDINKLDRRQMDSLTFMWQMPQNRLQQEPLFATTSGKINKPPFEITPVSKLRSYQRTGSTCYDSSGRFFIRKDSTHFYTEDVFQTADHSLLLAGTFADWSSGTTTINKASILKTDESGNVIWGKKYDSLNHVAYSSTWYYKTLELQNGNLILIGKTNNLVTDNEDMLVTKTDNNGNIIWSKTYRSPVWTQGNGSADYYYVQQMKEDLQTGNIYLTGPHWAIGRNITCLDQTNGNIVWSKRYNPNHGNYFENIFGLDILAGELRSFGLISGNTATWVGIYRINKATGDTLATKYFNISDPQAFKLGFLSTDPLSKTNNGHYRISGKCYGYFGSAPYYQGAICEFDENLDFVKAFCVRNNVETNQQTIRFSLFPDYTGLFAMSRYQGANATDKYYMQLNDDVIVKERRRRYDPEFISKENYAVRHTSGADMLVRLLGISNAPGSKVEYLKLQVTDTSSACIGINEPLSFLQPFNYVSASLGLISIIPGDFVESSNKTITAESYTANYVPGCQSTSFCDTIKLTASTDTVCGAAPVLLTVHKNAECGSNVLFNYNPTYVQSFTQINDTTYQVIFNGAWQGNIYAGIQSCATLTDSVHVVVFTAMPPVNLGADTSLCPGNTVLLTALNGYASYVWSNSATTASISVTTPGTYYVDVVDDCGNTSSDTVVVAAAPPIAFSIGADRTKCNADTIHINAPAGFLNYSWGPAYNINSQTAQNVIVQPLVDTLYFVRAEKTPGCFAYDSVHVKVNHAVPISLGADKNFCSGDSIILDAGSAFVQYAWNTGALTQKISVLTTGNYIVVGTDLNGCKSADTVQVTVYPLPVIHLNKDTAICFADVKTLDAGPGFSNYVWNTGATGSSIQVSARGKYWVVVKDIHSCIGSDTSEIRKINPLPAAFLPADTAVCSYASIQLVAAGIYNQYTWSDGDAMPAITVFTPGMYWLQVTDANSCTGKDSITVIAKECYRGFYIPGAFTPNHDGKNEIFTPQIFGNLSDYRFIIFNRYGQVVFSSISLAMGWNGTIKGKDATPGVYTWVCSFKLNGFQNDEKGTVLLLR